MTIQLIVSWAVSKEDSRGRGEETRERELTEQSCKLVKVQTSP